MEKTFTFVVFLPKNSLKNESKSEFGDIENRNNQE